MSKAAEDDWKPLKAPVYVSLSTSVGPYTFAAWYAQGNVDITRIHEVYVSLNGVTEENEEELLP